MDSKKICAVIPAYNASKTLTQVVLNLKKQLPNIVILVVDDGSIDTTKEIARNLDVISIIHKKNLGKGAALKSGFEKALSLDVNLIFTLDADGQHNPKDVKVLLSKFLEKKLDIIIGSRMSDTATMPIHRIISNKITSNLISWRIGQRIADSQCGFRLIRKDVLKQIELKSNRFEMESELIIKAALKGFKIGSTNIETIYGKNQKSAMNGFTDTLRFILLYLRSFFW